MSEPTFERWDGVAPAPPAGPITVDELLLRGCSDDLEGRALDVVLRCGWPRPGDPLGIKPCISIEVRELKRLAEMIDAEDGVHAKTKLNELRTFIGNQLRAQRYVMGLYVDTAAEANLPESYQTHKAGS